MNNTFGYYRAEISRKLALVLGDANLTTRDREMLQEILDTDLVGLEALLRDLVRVEALLRDAEDHNAKEEGKR
jgi:hypothetical protein